ncbi:MAG: gamma-glutamyl-gamma-aminobutyrate hydrolase family protein [Chloroflexi bacterium]|nr:gamma-glutamyl-gamma-aminobutyrate hydrolase family protein [Chloroflexota bacterium]
MSKVWVLQHTPPETLGTIQDALTAESVTAEYVRAFEGQPVPQRMGEATGLVVMGGPMGVYEQAQYPYLIDEIHLIEDALRADVPVIGVCLGSQLLASALGAEVVSSGQKEIGWHTVTLADAASTDPLLAVVSPSFTGFHWHGDIFDLPRDSVSLASSGMTAHQAFRYGDKAYGFLFHMEVTAEVIGGMVAAFADEMAEAGVTETEVTSGITERLPRLHEVGNTVFSRWADLISSTQD